MTDSFGYSTGCLRQWEWDHYGVNSRSDSHITDTGGSILMDGMSVHGNLFSLVSSEPLSCSKSTFLICDGTCASFSFGRGQFGYPKKQQGVAGTLHPPCLAPSQTCTPSRQGSPRTARLPRLCCSVLRLASLGSLTVAGCLAFKTSNMKKTAGTVKIQHKTIMLTKVPTSSCLVLHHQFHCVHLGKSCLCLQC